MPSDPNTTQNPSSTENSLPPSPQEPTLDAPIPPTESEPTEVPPEAPEAPKEDATPSLGKDSNGALDTKDGEVLESEKVSTNEVFTGTTGATLNPANTGSGATAQIPVFEPLVSKPTQKNLWERFLNKLYIGKQKKLEKIMTLFAAKEQASQLNSRQVTNDEVEKLLHVSDATATRYLSQLEKEGRIRQSGKTGKGVSYLKI